MNLELLLIRLFLNDTKTFHKYQKYLGVKHNNVYAKLYNTIASLKEDGNDSHSPEELALKHHVLYPIASPAETEITNSIFDSLKTITVTPEQGEEVLVKVKQRHIASDFALAAVKVAADEEPFASLLDKIKLLDELEGSDEETDFISDNIIAIRDRLISEPPWEFRLRTLNRIFGGLRRRTMGFIFARPEVGKTQLLASEATFLAPQLPNFLLWINNEEDGNALVPRCYQATLLKDANYIFKNAEEARKAYSAKQQGKIRIYDKPSATTKDIERIVRELRPDVVFIDQLDKVRGVTADRYDLQQKALYQWARELAKRYNCAVVGVCQAGGTAENKRYLDMNDVDSSHTAKQGEADWMFGLGATDRVGEEDRRYISVCKNKLPLSPKMVSEMRHAKIPIRSIPEFQIYEDVINVN